MGEKYSTTVDTDGKDYRWISYEMTRAGHAMRHSSVRNYFLRAMRRFVDVLAPHLDDDVAGEISRSASFHDAIRSLLHESFHDDDVV